MEMQKELRSQYIVYGFIAFASYFLIAHGYVMSFIFAMIVYSASNWVQKATNGRRFNINLYQWLTEKTKIKLSPKWEEKLSFSTGKILGSTFIIGFIVLISFSIIWLVMTLFDFVTGVEFNQLFELINTNLNQINEMMQKYLSAMGVNSVPIEIAKLREVTINFIRTHLSSFSQAGFIFSAQIVKILIGVIIGGILSFYVFSPTKEYKPLTKTILIQANNIREAFSKIFLAQCKISFIDALLTAAYLKIVLPYFGVDLPFTNLIVCLTFIFGLLPLSLIHI